MIWSAACFGFLSGTFADKFGVKPIMLVGLLIFSVIQQKLNRAQNQDRLDRYH
jgi:MFS family permease